METNETVATVDTMEVIFNYYWRAPAGTPLAAWLLLHMEESSG